MSRARAWAERRAEVSQHFQAINRERPGKCPEVYVSSVGWMHFEVDDGGGPVIVLPHGIRTEISGEHLARLLEQARWVLDTFAEPAAGETS